MREADTIHGTRASEQTRVETSSLPRNPNDVGALSFGPVDLGEREPRPWQMNVEALQRCLQARRDPLVNIDEQRRRMEELPRELYHSPTQYERWASSLTNLLIKKASLARTRSHPALSSSARNAVGS